MLLHRPDGSVDAVASNDVPSPGYFFARAHHIDSLAIVAVGVVLEVGGYSLDPAFHAFDDHELVHRLARLGHLIGFVPTVVGRYRVDDLSHSSTLGHQALPPGRLARMYDQDGKLVGSGTAGTTIGTIDPGDSAQFTVDFSHVTERLEQAATFQIALETR